jgi:hypothetical protein
MLQPFYFAGRSPGRNVPSLSRPNRDRTLGAVQHLPMHRTFPSDGAHVRRRFRTFADEAPHSRSQKLPLGGGSVPSKVEIDPARTQVEPLDRNCVERRPDTSARRCFAGSAPTKRDRGILCSRLSPNQMEPADPALEGRHRSNGVARRSFGGPPSTRRDGAEKFRTTGTDQMGPRDHVLKGRHRPSKST